jgi:hypothetical protein
MSFTEPRIDRERRGFVGLVLCTPAATAGTLLAVAVPMPAVAAAPLPVSRPRGYRPSAHTARYYDSLRY